MGTVELLEGLGAYLAGVGLAQWSATGDYRDTPGLPAVLLAGADTPDHCVVVSASRVGAVSLGQWDVSMAFRATGVGPQPVIELADAVSAHFIAAFDWHASGTWHGGTIVTLPSVTLPGGLVITGLAQTEWGTAELSSPAKHRGSRFVRTDKYRMTVRD